MSEELPERASRSFEGHEAFEMNDGGVAVTTVVFENAVDASETDDWALAYDVEVRVPMLSAATSDEVGDAVETGWFETFERRLEDAPMATRADLALDDYAVERDGDQARATFSFEFGNADRAPDVVKAIVEYVEGTYVEGIVPGYEYESPVADLLDSASQNGQGGGTPL
ncbi:DUF5813 family protein [Haloarculaceae archaeon H-GB2-1]|nr:DUF5813 family protein [Haloarculaceae archaeon H-GB1-1]MEA5388584.1 DUF5813 family protein [Haloarculaceae archaeon H-GB11]MEA5406638.1 DUF5813 family protein [Haloarculaceae archaeon H-GB2-1]